MLKVGDRVKFNYYLLDKQYTGQSYSLIPGQFWIGIKELDGVEGVIKAVDYDITRAIYIALIQSYVFSKNDDSGRPYFKEVFIRSNLESLTPINHISFDPFYVKSGEWVWVEFEGPESSQGDRSIIKGPCLVEKNFPANRLMKIIINGKSNPHHNDIWYITYEHILKYTDPPIDIFNNAKKFLNDFIDGLGE